MCLTEVVVCLVPPELNIVDRDTTAVAPGDRPGKTGINASGGRIEVALFPGEVRRDVRQWLRERCWFCDLYTRHTLQLLKKGGSIRARLQGKLNPQTQVGQGRTQNGCFPWPVVRSASASAS